MQTNEEQPRTCIRLIQANKTCGKPAMNNGLCQECNRLMQAKRKHRLQNNKRNFGGAL